MWPTVGRSLLVIEVSGRCDRDVPGGDGGDVGA
ncbi:hypothetical protein Ae406Ps2_6305c [Pseudonocardia sp. Ae406_Ps2]|nr:hypothetical protein Ae406Ps2_6305c [Pseudonocardia sp. Ae406_Ps2]